VPFASTTLEPVIEEKIKQQKVPRKKIAVKPKPPASDYTTENELRSLF
jgi:hypothetical protein